MKLGQGAKMDPAKRDYVIEQGAPVNDPTVLTPAYFRSMIPRERWMYAPDANYGSDFYREKNKNGPTKPSVIEATQERCLQPLVQDGRALSVTAEASSVTRSGIILKTKIVDTQGEPNVLVLPSIGV